MAKKKKVKSEKKAAVKVKKSKEGSSKVKIIKAKYPPVRDLG